MKKEYNDYIIAPDLSNELLTDIVNIHDENNIKRKIKVIEEKPLTIFLNNQEIITAMSIADYPKYLALGFLYNQRIIYDIKDIKCVSVRNYLTSRLKLQNY